MTTQHAFDRLEKLSPSDRAAVELKYDGSIPEDFTVPNFAPVTSDITVTNNGSTFSFHADTKTGLDALEDLETESWQWLGCRTLVVDHRLAEHLIHAGGFDGLVLS